ncbi:hypothetical protein [Afipia sp. DC4300-2b1]|uniref:hypothetical protein n=1 Tax=Afipia sp. DC4300-2b1 TaxID=2804672 RepID=UPI003CF86240
MTTETEYTRLNDADRAFVKQAIDALDLSMVRDWLAERQANCLRIARLKNGDDREGWLVDFVFFTAAKGMIDWTALERSEIANAPAPLFQPNSGRSS